MKSITTTNLRGACASQLELFVATFGNEAELTEQNMAKAMAAGLDVLWLERLLPAEAWAKYNKARAKAWAVYSKATAEALAEYGKATAEERAEYDKAVAPALAEYDKAVAPALAEYDKAVAAALLTALTKEDANED